MPRRGPVGRLRLGPVVGHTDDSSTRIWIRTFDDPSLYAVRLHGGGTFGFRSTEPPGQLEFHTAVATATGLLPDTRYRFSVLRRGRTVPRSRGTVRTMPAPGSPASLLFCVISCSTGEDEGIWRRFSEFVERGKPHFVLMVGDQVYIDEGEPDVYKEHLDSPPAVRRRALADKYQRNWSREPVRKVMASAPAYMMWDDHEIRDGFGSLASDSPTLAARFPRGRKLFEAANAFFEDARDVYWHFQGCHNPGPRTEPLPPGAVDPLPNYIEGPPPPGQRRAMPFAFRCGRLVVLVLDSRGERDAFRDELPILGAEQWGFVGAVLERLEDDVEALAIVTPTPIASQDPDGASQKLLGDRTDDVEAFRRGRLPGPSSKDLADAPLTVVNVHLSRALGRQLNLGNYMLSNLDEARDQWSHKLARPEQRELLRRAGLALRVNRPPESPRSLIFLSGDIHIGCIFDIESTNPDYRAQSLTSSGVAAVQPSPIYVGVYVDRDFSPAPGVRSTLREVVNDFNFGVVQMVPTGAGAELTPILGHEGASTVLGADVADLL